MSNPSSASEKHPLSAGKLFGAGLLAGAVAGVVMTAVMLLLDYLCGIATPLTIMGDRLSVFFQADTFLALMGRVGGYNHMKQLGVSSVIIGQIIVGSLGGAIYGRKALQLSAAKRRMISLGIFLLLPLLVASALLWPVLGTHYHGYPIATATALTVLGLFLSFLAFERALVFGFAWLIRRPRIDAPAMEFSPPIGRRALLLGGLGLVVAGGSAAILRKLYRAATFSYDGTQYKGEMVQAITPNDQFYCVTKNVVDPVVDASVWRLEVTGRVQTPQRFDIAQLQQLSAIKQETTLMCISNALGGGLMSNAVWTGVPMSALLEAAGPQADAAKVRMHGVDNYIDTIPLAKALDPQTLVVYEMNGKPLPQRHGFPARAIVPGYFGEKNVKWITRIELAGPEAKGFYEEQDWGPNFIVPTRSRIDEPEAESWFDHPTAAKGIAVKGVAFGGDRGVSRVEISVDDGANWTEAKLDYPGTKLTWALWSYQWESPKAGNYSLVVRATNGDGEVQQLDKDRPFKSGTTGFHKIAVYVG